MGVKWRNPATGKAEKDAAHAALSKRLKKDEDAEEDRLLYVAMTRAEDRLVLSYAREKAVAVAEGCGKGNWSGNGGGIGRAEIHAGGPRRVETAAPATPEIVLEAAVVTGQYDSSAAVTDVALFAACPRKYYLARYLGLTPEPGVRGLGNRRPAACSTGDRAGIEAHKALAGQRPNRARRKNWRGASTRASWGSGWRGPSEWNASSIFCWRWRMSFCAARSTCGSKRAASWWCWITRPTGMKRRGGVRSAIAAVRAGAGTIRGTNAGSGGAVFLAIGEGDGGECRDADLEEARGTVRALTAAQDALEFPMKVGEQCRRCWFYGGMCPAKLEEG